MLENDVGHSSSVHAVARVSKLILVFPRSVAYSSDKTVVGKADRRAAGPYGEIRATERESRRYGTQRTP